LRVFPPPLGQDGAVLLQIFYGRKPSGIEGGQEIVPFNFTGKLLDHPVQFRPIGNDKRWRRRTLGCLNNCVQQLRQPCFLARHGRHNRNAQQARQSGAVEQSAVAM
jgi:hypothetical protein